MTLHWTMGRPRRPNYANWRSQRTKRSIPIEKCTLYRKLSVVLTLTVHAYRYFEGGVSSVYLWDLDDGGFAGVVLLKKSTYFQYLFYHDPTHHPTAMTPNTPSEPSGSWDSIHVFEASERGRQAHYKLTSTIMLQLVTHKGAESDAADGQDRRGAGVGAEGHGKGKSEGWKKEGEVSLSGSMTRQVRLCSPFRVGVLAK